MTDETIASLLDKINDGFSADWAFVRPISTNIKFGRVWTDLPNGVVAFERGYPFYFIHSMEGQCIGAVLDMGPSDLHVFVKPEYRRQGVMTRALRDTILPHLFRDNRSEQCMTFLTAESRGLIEKLGFEFVDEGKAKITAEKCQKIVFSEDKRLPFPEDRMKAIMKRIGIAASLLRMASEECALYLDSEFVEEIEFHEGDLRSLSGRVEDAWWAQEK